MTFAKMSKDKDDLKQSQSNYITKSGVYPVTVLAAFVDITKNGSTVVNLFVDHNGQEQTLYGNMRLYNNDGSVNEIGMKVFNQLLVIGDIESVADPVDSSLPIGKEGKDKEVSVLEDISDVDNILIRVQIEYSEYNGKIQENKVIKGFYRASDLATAEEVVTEENIGKTYEKDEPYFDKITYRDELTADDIAAWVKNNRQGGRGAGSAKSTPAFGNAPKTPFGNKPA